MTHYINTTENAFTQSMANYLLNSSPAEFKLNWAAGEFDRTKQMDDGTVIHQLVLGNRYYTELDYPDYRTKEARERRDAVRAAGGTPVLKHEARAWEGPAGKLRHYIEAEFGLDLDACELQKRSFWSEGTNLTCEQEAECGALRLLCSGEPDILCTATDLILDIKVTPGCTKEKLESHVASMGYHVQAAAYRRLFTTRFGRPPSGYYLVCFDKHTHLAKHHELLPSFIDFGDKQWCKARELFARCFRNDHWPHYDNDPLMPPNWLYAKMLEGEP